MAGSQTWDNIATRDASWCSLCGVILDRCQARTGHPPTDLSWLGEIRAVHSTDVASDVSVSGAGYLDHANVVRANACESLRYDYRPPIPLFPGVHDNYGGEEAPPPVSLEAFPIFNASHRYWCFPVHDACWELLHDRVGTSVPPGVVARHLFAVLHNTPVNGEGTLVPVPGPGGEFEEGDTSKEKDHYGGAAAFQEPHLDSHRYGTLVKASGLTSHMTGDPRDPLRGHHDCLWEAVQAVSRPFFSVSTEDGRMCVGDGEAPEGMYYHPSPSSSSSPLSGGSRDEEKKKAHHEEDPLVRLPNELITLVLCHLPTRDLGSLRLASRYAADVSTPRRLPPLYWASRFAPEQEMGFVFAGPWSWSSTSTAEGEEGKDEDEKQDWLLLYLKARAMSSARGCSGLSPGFRNRRRIWDALRHVAEAVRLRVANDASFQHDENGSDPTTLYRNLDISLPAGLQAGDAVAADAELDPELIDHVTRAELRYKSCRLFGLGDMTLPDEQEEAVAATTRLDVSLIYYNGRTHVCGFSVSRAAPGNDQWVELSRAGYVSPWRQRSVVLGADEALREIEVAMSTTGVRGMCFHIQGKDTRDGRRRTEMVGNMNTDDPDTGVGKLVLNAQWTGFVVGVDACKVILLSLLKRPDQDSHQDTLYLPHLQHFVELWSPSPLPQAKRILGWQREHHILSKQSFDLGLNMDFSTSSDGEPGGLLRSLVRVTVYMGGFPNVFLGMAFSYTNGRERRFGRRPYCVDGAAEVPAIEQSFALDGPGGEFIVGFASTHSGCEDDVLEGIKLFTNRGRMAEFRLCYKRFYYPNGAYGTRGDRTHVYVAPEDGRVLTRFFAKLKFPGGYFRDFVAGISSLEELFPREVGIGAPHEVFDGLQDDGHSIPITDKLLVSAHEILSYPRGVAFSAGRFVGMRRIRVSVGRPGHSRSERHVSGVRLEYTDDGSDAVILGQWIQELDGGDGGILEVAPGDRVVEMTTWHESTIQVPRATPLVVPGTYDRVTNTYTQPKFGPIARLWLRTARGCEITFSPSGTAKRSNQVCLKYRENPYEELGGILWGCNYEHDHVRALYHPRASSSSLPYSLESVPPVLVYTPKAANFYGSIPDESTWVVREQVFMREQIVATAAANDKAENAQKVDDPAAAIEVSYHEEFVVSSQPLGISVIYASGAIVTIGTRGKKRVTRDLDGPGGEALLRMDIGLECHGRQKIGFVRFHTSRSRILDFYNTWSHSNGVNNVTAYLLAPDAPSSDVTFPHPSPPPPSTSTETPPPPPPEPSPSSPTPPSSSSRSTRRRPQAQQAGGNRNPAALAAPRGRTGGLAGFRITSVPPSTTPRAHEEKVTTVKEVPFPKDAGEFVGLWAAPEGCDPRELRYGMLGPVFTGKKKKKTALVGKRT